MLSTNNTMTQTHALYMEHKAIATATEVGRYEIQNGNNGNLPHTPDPLKADCEELFYTLNVLLSTLGQPIFESLSLYSAGKIILKILLMTIMLSSLSKTISCYFIARLAVVMPKAIMMMMALYCWQAL